VGTASTCPLMNTDKQANAAAPMCLIPIMLSPNLKIVNSRTEKHLQQWHFCTFSLN
jgi:hypothetical protein